MHVASDRRGARKRLVQSPTNIGAFISQIDVPIRSMSQATLRIVQGDESGWCRTESRSGLVSAKRGVCCRSSGSHDDIAVLAPLMEPSVSRMDVIRVRRYCRTSAKHLGRRISVRGDCCDIYVRGACHRYASCISGRLLPSTLLRYLPTWMPCGSWKKDILVLNKDLDAMRYVHSKFVKEQIARGDWSISVAFDSLSLACYRKLCGKFYVKALGRRSQHDSRAVGQRCGIFFLCWWLRSAIRLPFGHDVLPRGS